MARKFLYLIAIVIVLMLAGAFALRMFDDQLSEVAFVPPQEFEEQEPLEANIYEDAAMWFQRPGEPGQELVEWLPEGFDGEDADALNAAIFFVHPTSYLSRKAWNAPLNDVTSQDRAKLFVKSMASAFARGGDVWAPRYRQATFGAFLTDRPEREKALSLAYGDIGQAFDRFIAEVPPSRPIILAGHSQGALHLMHLLADKVKGTPLADRVIAAYLVGWPVSIEADLPALGLPQCEAAEDIGCIISWQSYAEPAEPETVDEYMGRTIGLTGEPRTDTRMICTNPVTGMANGESNGEDNGGTLKPDAKLENAEMLEGLVPARCDERGLLLIGDPPDLGPYVLPGNNYHVYDIPLFWRSVRSDVERRTRAWSAPK